MKNRHLSAMALACLLLAPIAASSQVDYEGALAQARDGRVAEALRRVEEAIAADPSDPRAQFTRGVILAESGRRNAAQEVFQRLIERHPEMPEAYNNLAVIQAAAGDFDGAVNTLKGALATNPSYQTAYENLTRIFAQLASEAYSRALEVDSPTARDQVELQMLGDLSAPSPFAQETGSGQVATRKLTPDEPMADPIAEAEAAAEAVPAEPMVADSTPASGQPAMPETEAPRDLGPAEGEDLELKDMRAPSEPVAGEEAADVGDVVERWARAWSEQRVDDYLSFYDDEFLPDNGMSREDWVINRKDRLAAPEFIKVEVAILDSSAESDGRASVTFLQAYESDTYRDQVTKTLTLVKDGADWKILEEKSGP